MRQSTVTICPNVVLGFIVVISLTMPVLLGGLGALVFLTAGLALLIRRPQTALFEIRHNLWIYSVPVWCILSVIWSQYAGLSLRGGIQLGLTFLIAVTVASRLPPRHFVKVVFLALTVTMFVSLALGSVRSDGALTGVAGSKNAFSAVMSIYLIASMALLLDRAQPAFWRIAGLAGLACGGPVLLMAQSAGAVITSGIVLACMVAFATLRRLTGGQKATVLVFVFLLMLLGIVVFLQFQREILAAVLESTGKDVTLTGRTDLWALALVELARNPLFGQGYMAVWVPGNPVAEQMWAQFGITNKYGFHFHNTFLSNAVEIGLIGAGVQLALFATAVWLTLRWVIADPKAETLFLAGFMLRQLLLCMVEVVVYMQFDPTTVLSVCALVYGLRSRRRPVSRHMATPLPRHRPHPAPPDVRLPVLQP